MYRVGSGHDTHRLVEGRPLVLGGVRIDHPRGLAGHSDADVILHAVTDAVLGASALGDIGDLYPDTDAVNAGLDSAVFLRGALARLAAAGWRVVNVDVTVFAQEPKLGPLKGDIRTSLARILSLDVGDVSVKAKTGEHVGHIGRGEAIGCHAVVLVVRADRPTETPMAGSARTAATVLGSVVLAALVVAAVVNIAIDEELGGGESADLVPPWLLGRLVALGYGPDAYDPPTQIRELRSMVDWQGPPPDDTPERRRTRLAPHRVDLLDSPQIRANGLCPYPPTSAILYAPLGRMWFADAADMLRYISLGLAVLCVPLIYWAVEGRLGMLWCGVFVLYYPGSYYTLQLGQNSFVTLALLAGGWSALVRSRDVTAGLIWGLFAYKFIWLGAVGWLPLVLGRPKVLMGMAISAGLFVAVSVAEVGLAAWPRWFAQGQTFDRIYAFDLVFRDTLLGMGCDLRSMAYRLGPILPAPWVRPLGWTFIAGVIVVTAWSHRRRPNPTALLFGACLACPHLYFYDQVVFLLPLAHLWSRHSEFRPWQWIAAVALSIAFYGSLVIMQYFEWEGPPTATLVVLALWLLSLTLRGRA